MLRVERERERETLILFLNFVYDTHKNTHFDVQEQQLNKKSLNKVN
jgi:hypothetical protein